MKKQFLEAGEFTTTHGIGGELRLYPWCDSPEFLTGFSVFYLDAEGGHVLEADSVRPHKSLCIVKLRGVDGIEQARPFIGKTVYIDRRDATLAPGRFFVQDLLGARVENADTGEVYGEVAEVKSPGRHDVWVVKNGPVEHLFPAVEPFLVSLDLEGGVAKVRPIEGMFEPDPPKVEKRRPRKKKGGAGGEKRRGGA